MVGLRERGEETVRFYFELSRRQFIRDALPQKAHRRGSGGGSQEVASPLFTIISDGRYVGGVWCCRIDKAEVPNAMLSYCVFDRKYRNAGFSTAAVALFMREIRRRFVISSLGAFTFTGVASIRVLEKGGFELMEEFTEDGRNSRCYQLSFRQ